ncbi:hypothetical protein [Beduini massiliensis]|uniref:hypothetical protein n=1 Tax=Beduini massiliensis TaxID=1585974 RepID=UPI00059A9211|nr:hypothetical protein [Beduini massiliensis]
MKQTIIDLNKYADRAVEFMIGDKVIRCPELSYKEMEKVQQYEQNSESTRQDEMEMILFLLNRNTAKIKFTKLDIGELPAGAVTRIYQECVLLSRKPLNDPN